MKTQRFVAVAAAFLALCLVHGCDLTEMATMGQGREPLAPDETGSGRAASGHLEDGALRLEWQTRDEWAQGWCVDLRLFNDGPAVSGWTLTLSLDEVVADWAYLAPHHREFGDAIVMEPAQSTARLERGGEVELSFCAEPHVRPSAMEMAVGYVHAGGDAGASPSPGGDPKDDAYGTGGQTRLVSGDVTLYSYGYDAWPGGTCVHVTLENRGPELDDWRLRLRLSTSVVIHDWPRDTYFLDSSGRDLFFEPYGFGSFRSRSSKSLWFCGEPAARVEEFVVEGEVVLDGGFDEPDDPGSGSGADDGELVAAPLTLRWWVSASWSGGGCVRGELRNDGPPLEGWSADIALEADPDRWSGLSGSERTTRAGATITLEPRQPADALATGEAVSLEYCTEPLVVPTGLTVEGAGAADAPSYGELADEEGAGVVLKYSAAGSADGLECLQVTVINTTTDHLPLRGVRCATSGAIDFVDVDRGLAWKLPDGAGFQLDLPREGAGSEGLEGGGSFSARVCMTPLEVPRDFAAVWSE